MKWPFVHLADVAEINPRRKDTSALGPKTIVGFVPMSAVSETTATITTVEPRPFEEVNKGFTAFRENDVLFAKITPCMENGKAAVARGLPNGVGFGSTEFHVLRPRTGLIPEFIYYFVRQPSFRVDAKRQFRGAAGQQRVPDSFLVEYRVPLPAPSEQRRIVELLEQADALRRLRTEADALAVRILPALFRRMFGDPVTNPKGWPVQPLGQLADFVSGATPSKERAEFWDGVVPWVSAKDMKALEITDSIDHISETALRDTNIKLIAPGAVLIVVRGMILAHTVPIALNQVPLTINQDMKALVPVGDVPAEFLQWALLSQHQNVLRLVTTAAHGTRKLDTDALNSLPIPVPVAQLEQFTRHTREQSLTRECRRSVAEKIETIFKVMLHRAFTGELTARWRGAHLKELLAEMEQQSRYLNTKEATP